MKSFLLVLWGAVAAAAPTMYMDSSLWLQDTFLVGTVDFSGIAGTGDVVSVGSTLVLPVGGTSVTFGSLGDTQMLVADRDAPGYDFGVPATLNGQLGFPSSIRVELPGGINAVAANLTGFLGDPTNFAISLATANGTFQFNLAGGGFPPFQFIGFRSDSLIESITFSASPSDLVIANFSAGSPVPEPSTWVLMVSAGAAGWFRLRRRR